MAERSLYDVYLDVMMQEPLDLPGFLRRVDAGAYGSFQPSEVVAFLREVERDIIANIHTMVEANPHLSPQVDERIDETRQMIAELVARYDRQP